MNAKPLLSFVVPFYKRFANWDLAMSKQFCMSHPDFEIVLVLDEPTEEQQVLEAIRTKYADKYNFRVLVNDKDHEWRLPSSPINVGVKHALAENIAIISPESILMMPCKRYLHHKIDCLNTVQPGWLAGCVIVVQPNWVPKLDDFGYEYWALYSYFMNPLGFANGWAGFTLIKKEHIYHLTGFHEGRPPCRHEDQDMRERLIITGVHKFDDHAIRMAHISHGYPESRKLIDASERRRTELITQMDWGNEPFRVAYDWAKQ